MTPKVLLQAFYKRGKYVAVPCPGDPNDAPEAEWWWDHLASNAAVFGKAGFTSIWLPPVTKAEQGCSAAALGYSVYDDYDIGWKNQKATIHTRYGNREQLTRLAAMLRANGLDVYLDLQLNHRKGGSGPDEMTFNYLDAFGNLSGGRFAKNAQCFHSRYPAGAVPANFKPEIPQDPGVPDGIGELQMGSKVYFGPDLAPVNGLPRRYVFDGLVNCVNWVSQALDAQGYRLDHVQGISALFLRELLNGGTLQGKFAVGEYWDGDVSHVNSWVTGDQWMQSRCSAFDFPLYFALLAMSNDPSFDMANLDHAGLAGTNPLRAVTFVENHDTESRRDLVPKNIQPEDKPLAYAYILTSEGLPCVFYKDYRVGPDCLGGQLQPILNNLLWIHQNIASGSTQQRWKNQDVFAFERTGGSRLLVGLNKNKQASQTIGVSTGFGANTLLHDYTGHAGDVRTDGAGNVTVTIPRNANGLGYVCYSVSGVGDRFVPGSWPVTQVFEGATDLDIKPAVSNTIVQVCRLWISQGSQIVMSLSFDSTKWTAETGILLSITAPTGTILANQLYDKSRSGLPFKATTTAEGWHSMTVRSQGTPPTNPNPAYKLTVTYNAPRVFNVS